jgi:hypothetical protein
LSVQPIVISLKERRRAIILLSHTQATTHAHTRTYTYARARTHTHTDTEYWCSYERQDEIVMLLYIVVSLIFQNLNHLSYISTYKKLFKHCLNDRIILNIMFTYLSYISGWRYGAFLCKITPYVQSVVQCASVNTLAAIAFDR